MFQLSGLNGRGFRVAEATSRMSHFRAISDSLGLGFQPEQAQDPACRVKARKGMLALELSGFASPILQTGASMGREAITYIALDSSFISLHAVLPQSPILIARASVLGPVVTRSDAS